AAPDLPLVREAAGTRSATAARLTRPPSEKSVVRAAHCRDSGRLPSRSAGEPTDLADPARISPGASRRRTRDDRGHRTAWARPRARSSLGPGHRDATSPRDHRDKATGTIWRARARATHARTDARSSR